MDLDRVRDVLSIGDSEARRLIEVPTGHMLKSSREALDVFQLIAVEIARMATGRLVRPALPDLATLEASQRAERRRLRDARGVELRPFWSDYLLGRSRRLGIELMNETSAYRRLMESQIDALELGEGQRIADLGSGTGPLIESLLRAPHPRRLRLDQLDYVIEGLRRARARVERRGDTGDFDLHFISGDLAVAETRCLPFRSRAYDAVLASLVLSYLERPENLLKEIHRILKPGGRIVVSTLKPDADVSKIYVDGLAELRGGVAREAFGPEVEAHVDELGREFLNEAARLLDLEEQGLFHFWAAEDLAAMLERAGFRDICHRPAFGEPPQAVVVSGLRR
jgi:ubiquinone/menaquinone biosynthesis C-methylase UbiE